MTVLVLNCMTLKTLHVKPFAAVLPTAQSYNVVQLQLLHWQCSGGPDTHSKWQLVVHEHSAAKHNCHNLSTMIAVIALEKLCPSKH
jgi:hypothetical protein